MSLVIVCVFTFSIGALAGRWLARVRERAVEQLVCRSPPSMATNSIAFGVAYDLGEMYVLRYTSNPGSLGPDSLGLQEALESGRRNYDEYEKAEADLAATREAANADLLRAWLPRRRIAFRWRNWRRGSERTHRNDTFGSSDDAEQGEILQRSADDYCHARSPDADHLVEGLDGESMSGCSLFDGLEKETL